MTPARDNMGRFTGHTQQRVDMTFRLLRGLQLDREWAIARALSALERDVTGALLESLSEPLDALDMPEDQKQQIRETM